MGLLSRIARKGKIDRVSGLTTGNTSISPQSGGAFDGNGGTQVLVLKGSTTGTKEVSVTLIGESTAQWRIISAFPESLT